MPVGRRTAGPFALAGVASIGAGCLHLGAIGSHRDDPGAALTFAALAVAQLAWGAIAVPARHRVVAVVGLVLSAAAVLGWLLAKTTGIPGLPGLTASEPVQVPDLLAAVLAAVSGVLLARAVLVGPRARVPNPAALAVAVASVVALVGVGAAATPGHRHVHADQGPVGHGHGAGVVLADGWDPSAPVDLSGGAGVTAAEQDRAERFATAALAAAERHRDRDRAVADGFEPVGDASTGVEHLVRWAAVADDRVADPQRPESLVYDVAADGRRTLVAVRFLLPPGTTPGSVPELGGALTPWEPVEDLCLRDAGGRLALAGADGSCPEGTEPAGRLLGLHLWVVPHACGPFASVEAADARAGRSPACGEDHGG